MGRRSKLTGMEDAPLPSLPPEGVPPRAFAQGVGLVFQATGVGLFVLSMFVCCGSSLLSKDVATSVSLQERGWRWSASAQPDGFADYSVQRAVTVSLAFALF